MWRTGVWFREDDHAGRVAVKEIASPDRTDLSLREKSSRGERPEALLHDSTIVMGLAKEALSTPATTEQKGSKRRILVLRAIRGQEKVQVVAGRFGIAEMELHSLSFLNDISDGDSPGLLIRTDEVTNEEVAPLKMTLVLIDDDAKV